MFEVQILIPVADNAGRIFTQSHHDSFEAFAVGLFSGITRLPNEAAGVWADTGVLYRDQARIYIIALRSIVNGGQIGELASFAKAHYAQLAVYIRYLALAEVL